LAIGKGSLQSAYKHRLFVPRAANIKRPPHSSRNHFRFEQHTKKSDYLEGGVCWINGRLIIINGRGMIATIGIAFAIHDMSRDENDLPDETQARRPTGR
jgi:hypothetical protein